MLGQASDDVYRQYQLILACRSGERLTVEGVDLDLNHPDLDRDEWEPLSVLGDYPTTEIEPSLALPWTDPTHIRHLQLGGAKILRVRDGDRLTVSRVEPYSTTRITSGALDHPHHRERRLVFLSVIRPDGEVVEAPGCWLFAGVADVMTPIALGDYHDARRALITRFERISGLDDLIDWVDDFSEVDWNAKFDDAHEDVRRIAEALWKAEDDLANHAAMAFGYLIGRAEGQQGRRDQAKTASKNTRSTGDQTRREAISVIDATPGIVLARCAEKVAVLVKKNTRSVTRTIKPMFAKGEDGVMRPDPAAVDAVRARLPKDPNAAKR
jgi:hypothetical protein